MSIIIDINKTKVIEEGIDDGENNDKKERTVQCFYCHFEFVAEKSEKLTSPKCPKCESNYLQYSSSQKKCIKCNETIKLLPHMKKIEKTSENLFKIVWRIRCRNCNTMQPSPRGKLPRTDRNYFECDICGKSFKFRHLIYVHMDSHLQDEELKCRVCQKKSKNRGVLRTHLKLHFEDKNFVCHHCGYFSKTSQSLKSHLEAHRADPTQVKDCSNTVVRSRFDRKPPEDAHFPCKYCGLSLKTKTALTSHEYRHEKNDSMIFKCKICPEVFNSANDLRSHNMSHSNRPLLFCNHPGCSQFFNRLKMLNTHIRNVHKEKNIFCEICNKKFKLRGSLTKHLKNNRCIPVAVRKAQSGMGSTIRSTLNKFKDPQQLAEEAKIAKEQFREIGGILRDENGDDSETKNSSRMTYLSDADEESDTGDDKSDTGRNRKIFSSSDEESDNQQEENIEIKEEVIDFVAIDSIKEEEVEERDVLDTLPMMNIEIKIEPADQENISESQMFVISEHSHILNEANSALENEEKFQKIKRLSKNQKNMKSDNRNFSCLQCSEIFPSKIILRNHLYENHNIKYSDALRDPRDPFICDLCGKNFQNFGAISAHIRITHKKIADFHCHLCPAKFKTKMYVERHIQDVHEKIFRFVCKVCGKFFRRKHQVKEHEWRHNDPVPCTVCNKLVTNLKTHIKLVHELPKKKSEYTCCPECGQMVSIYNLKHHIERIHKKLPIPGKMYPCVQCNEAFVRMDDLRRHKYTTHLDKPFKQCPFEGCMGIFPKTKALTVHIRNVHRENRIPCRVCNKNFQTESGVRKHMLIKHKLSYRRSTDPIDLITGEQLQLDPPSSQPMFQEQILL